MSVPSYQAQKEYTFVSEAYPTETFTVARFTGTEGLSRLYEFDITMISDDPEIDSRLMLRNPATLTIQVDDAEFPFHGVLSRFEQLQEVDETVFYRAVLVPRLWQASLYHENQLFLGKSVPDIIEEILHQAGLTSNDYEFRLTGSYEPWEYVCQFRETDFDFISRWMEREGIYYFFEQLDNEEKLIITDSSTSHPDISGRRDIPYLPPSGQAPIEEDCVHAFTCQNQVLPMRVMLKDYNYRRPTLDLRGEADVDAEGGRGTIYTYGEHFKTPEQGNALARIRAEAFLCRAQVMYGESTAANLSSGYVFELTDHYRISYNQRYLVAELTHEGRSSRFLLGDEFSAGGADRRLGYNNHFVAIPAGVQFRPERKTDKPRFYGTMNATVDAAGDGQYAEIDDEGRYKVILPFDQSGNTGGKASRWIRMAQPYAGANYGMHFPLHKGAEVLLTFVDGDPDRPIISSSVPNPDTMSPVTGGNQTQSVIRTGGGNQIRIEDNDGAQQIHMSSPTQNSIISLGSENRGNIYFHSDGTWVTVIGDDATEEIEGNKDIRITGNEEKIVIGNQALEVTGDQGVKVGGNQQIEIGAGRTLNIKSAGEIYTVTGNRTISVSGKEKRDIASEKGIWKGPKEDYTIGNKLEFYGGAKEALTVATAYEVFAGLKHEVFLGGKLSISAGKKIEIGELKTSTSSKNKIDAKVAQVKSGAYKIKTAAYNLRSSNYKMKAAIAELKAEKITIG